jgi:hypothetical protein
MTALSIQPPFPLITDIDGQPLEDGYIWIGVANLPPIGNPIAVYWDAALTIPAALPVRTRGGYPVNAGTPARLYVGSDYSILVQNKNGSTLYSAPEATEAYGGGIINASVVVYDPAGSGAVPTTVQAKLRETVSVKDFGAAGDGVTDDTVAIQAAMTAAAAVNAELEFAGATYAVTSTGTFALTAPASLTMIGVPGVTTIKLLSTTGDTHIIGQSGASTYFRMEGITLDGNKSVISTRNVGGLYFSNAQVVISRNNIFKDMNDLGAYASKCIYVEAPTLGEYAESTGDQYLNCEGYPFQTYRIARNIVEDAYCTGALTSFTDINGQTIPSTIYAKTQINNNVVICDAAFPSAFSVLSLMGNDIECVGNKINGGGTQIVCHDGTTDTLYNYLVSGNFLWQSKVTGIVVNQGSGASATNRNVVVSGNMIYQPIFDGIVVVGSYAGGSTTPQASITISGNVIYDYLTNNPDAGSAVSSIRLLSTVNATVVGNSIIGPRWAGITLHYDGRNIVVADNVITDHQGRTSTGGGTGTPQAGGPIFVSGGNATAYLGNISITGNVIRNYGTQVSPQASYVRTGGIVVNESKAQDITIRGNRVMTGNMSGISLFNCVNVTAMDNEVTGFYSEALNTASGIGAGCQLAYAVSGPTYAATGSRPTLQSTQAGYSMWDSTLAKPIWWNGSVWKDASNATV